VTKEGKIYYTRHLPLSSDKLFSSLSVIFPIVEPTLLNEIKHGVGTVGADSLSLFNKEYFRGFTEL
jgi:hypothetical protein